MSTSGTSRPTRDECDALLNAGCIDALSSHKSNAPDYDAIIQSLSKICDCIVTHYGEKMTSVIAQMEQVMTEAHNHDIEAIDKKIKHLFNLRKQMPCNSSYCEQEVIKLTTEIRLLEEKKAAPVHETIQKIIYDSIKRAIKTYGTDPGNFNLIQYEYKPKIPR